MSLPWQLALGMWLDGRPVTAAAPAIGQVLVWSGSEWVPGAGSGPPAGGASWDDGTTQWDSGSDWNLMAARRVGRDIGN